MPLLETEKGRAMLLHAHVSIVKNILTGSEFAMDGECQCEDCVAERQSKGVEGAEEDRS